MRDRSWRRSQRDRAIARVIRDHYFLRPQYQWDEEQRQIAIRQRAVTPQPCSNYCCGNPRRWFGGFDRITLQEHRALLNYSEELDFLLKGDFD